MYDAVTELMRALAARIAADVAFADAFGCLSFRAETRGANALATAFATRGRTHRVNLIALHAQLGALVEAYGPLHLEQP